MNYDRIINFEKKAIEETDYYLPDEAKGKNFEWYGVYQDNKIEVFHILSQLLATEPEFIILKRATLGKVIYIYYTKELGIAHYIPFGRWKLFAPSPHWQKNSYYFLEDGFGERRKIDLSEHLVVVPRHLESYIKFNSFREYELNEENQKLKNKISELERSLKIK